MSELVIDSRLIGQAIKHLRLSRNWTQDYLADRVGYSVRNLRRIENDGTTSIDIVNTFADIFGVSAIDILNGDVFVSFIFQYPCNIHHIHRVLPFVPPFGAILYPLHSS